MESVLKLHFIICYILLHKYAQGTAYKEVLAVVGQSVKVPCELTPLEPSDSAYLVLWYKDIFGTPIYSYDTRNGVQHWKSESVGNRALFHIENTGFFSSTGSEVLRSYLMITDVQPEDKGFYRCRVDFVKARTRNVKVTVSLIELPSKPVITDSRNRMISNITSPMHLDALLNLKCSVVGGDPGPQLTWFLEASPGNRKVLHVKNVTNEAQLKFGPLQRTHFQKVVGCSATNTNLTDPLETAVSINMILPPTMANIVRKWSYFVAGKSYNVTCQVFGSHPQAYTKLFFGKQELKILQLELNAKGDVSTTTAELVVTEADDDKFLVCRAENPHLPSFAVEDQWRLEIHYLPTVAVINSGNASIVRQGDVIELECKVLANPQAHSVHWRRNGMPAEDRFASGNVYKVTQADRQHSGNYSCLAHNILGSRESKWVELRVSYAPVCKRRGTLLSYVPKGDNITLNCLVDAFPSKNLTFKWKFGDKLLAVFSRHDSLSSDLTYSPKLDVDYGLIDCTAINSVGQQLAGCSFELRLKASPQLQQCVIKEFGSDWIQISCILANNTQIAPSTELWVTAISTEGKKLVQTFSSTDFILEHLQPNRTYWIEITANSALGPSNKINLEGSTTLIESTVLSTVMSTHENSIKLIPIVCALAGVIAFLMLLVVLIVVGVRSRQEEDFYGTDEANDIQTHISFNKNVDLNPPPPVGKMLSKSQSEPNKSNSYEKLNNVQFEGISNRPPSFRHSLTTVDVPVGPLCVFDEDDDDDLLNN